MVLTCKWCESEFDEKTLVKIKCYDFEKGCDDVKLSLKGFSRWKGQKDQRYKCPVCKEVFTAVEGRTSNAEVFSDEFKKDLEKVFLEELSNNIKTYLPVKIGVYYKEFDKKLTLKDVLPFCINRNKCDMNVKYCSKEHLYETVKRIFLTKEDFIEKYKKFPSRRLFFYMLNHIQY